MKVEMCKFYSVKYLKPICTIGHKASLKCHSKNTCPDYIPSESRMKYRMKPEWMPENPWEGDIKTFNDIRLAIRQGYEQGCQAQAKALVEWLGAQLEEGYDAHGHLRSYVIPEDKWAKLLEEVGL